jgi:hypothetical protein
MIEVFLNERSLHAQFRDVAEVSASLVGVNFLLARIAELRQEKRVLYDPRLYNAPTIGSRNFSSCLEHIPDTSARLQFKLLIRQRLRVTDWHAEQLHALCSYVWEGREVVDSSVAELAERSLQNRMGFLLNFSPSDFPSGHCIEVRKDSGEAAILHSVNNGGDLDQWCKSFPKLGLNQYDPTCGRPPLDEETCLVDGGRFQRMRGLRNKERQVYLERRTNLYFCVDSGHRRGDAHLEVFDARGNHIGEASLGGEIDTSKADATKELSL